uniref:NB-ARC domain-containing protein n=1 Tax=Fagus sylvatica TaxID=28930 RepID=A0A2N9HXT2_FAGSY
MSIIGEAALSAFFQVMFDKLTSPDLLKIFKQEQVDADLKKWKTMLPMICAVLDDAEEKQVTSKFVKKWLDELEDLAYDADDILDEFATEALRCNSIMFDTNMRSKIKEIDTRLQEIVTWKNDLQLTENTGGRTKTTSSRALTTSVVNEGHIYGRDEDKKAIVKLLLSAESSDAQPSVIPILGMGGMGKTTLVQQAYNDDDVNRYFDLKAWGCVSEDFNIVKVTKEIIQSVTSEPYDVNDLNLLQVKLKEKLSGKKFLVILDDVWNENYNDWTKLRCPFEFGAPGSKIVITTRNDRVSSTMGTTQAYMLKELSNDACLTVFTQNALGTRDFSAHPELEEVGRKISERCKGLPLAAKALGGLLRTIHDRNKWEDVLNNKIWDMSDENSDVLPTLKLSYLYLPSHLKRCFAYCSLFPKDYEFEEKELVLLWMAEGLVQETERKPMEELGCEHFHDLYRRSFFQQSSSNESLFVMHDLINDLARWAAGDSCYILEDTMGGNKQSKISTKVRHFSYTRQYYDGIQKFEDFPEDMHLRTFLPQPLKKRGYLTNHVPSCLLPKLRYLRVLSLGGYEIVELPDSIGNLKHLRYLNLSGAKIRSLPESISSLYNLQTLILKGCSRLIKLPEKIGNLVNLRHLDITDVNSIKEMPVGIEELKSLQTLSNFVVGKHTGSKIGDLMNLKFLHGRLCISRLENVLDAEDARRANLNGKKNLDALAMKWESADDDLQDARVAIDVLDMLRPWTTVKELSIDGYVGVKFPTWLGHSSFSNMVHLRIERCRKCTSLPAIGQLPSLKDLVIIGMAKVQSVGPEFYGVSGLKPFQSLETLHFEDMQEWKDWIPCGDEYEEFSCLHLKSLTEEFMHGLVKVENLTIDDCKEMTSMWQDKLMFLVTLDIRSCPSLITVSLMSTIRTLKIEDCSALKSLPMSNCTCLEDATITECNSLTFISRGQLPSTLKRLVIRNCVKLQSVVDVAEAPSSSSLLINEENLNTSLLEQLVIINCPSLKFLSSRGDLPVTLKILQIWECSELTSLSSSGQLPIALKHLYLKSLPEGLHKLCHLIELTIWECSSLVSFPDGGLLPTSLRKLWISDCEKLEALPNPIHNLTSLHDLRIYNCGSIISFPEEGYPTNLTSLRLEGVNICKQVFEWGLHRLTSLTSLYIEGGFPDWQSFPSEEEDGKMMMTLPTSLTTLQIWSLPNIVFLSSKGFQNLSALQQLEIRHCPKLEFLPEKGLPPSLLVLQIIYCPLLKQHCKKGKGREWLKIANIPLVLIDHRSVYEVEEEEQQ